MGKLRRILIFFAALSVLLLALAACGPGYDDETPVPGSRSTNNGSRPPGGPRSSEHGG